MNTYQSYVQLPLTPDFILLSLSKSTFVNADPAHQIVDLTDRERIEPLFSLTKFVNDARRMHLCVRDNQGKIYDFNWSGGDPFSISAVASRFNQFLETHDVNLKLTNDEMEAVFIYSNFANGTHLQGGVICSLNRIIQEFFLGNLSDEQYTTIFRNESPPIDVPLIERINEPGKRTHLRLTMPPQVDSQRQNAFIMKYCCNIKKKNGKYTITYDPQTCSVTRDVLDAMRETAKNNIQEQNKKFEIGDFIRYVPLLEDENVVKCFTQKFLENKENVSDIETLFQLIDAAYSNNKKMLRKIHNQMLDVTIQWMETNKKNALSMTANSMFAYCIHADQEKFVSAKELMTRNKEIALNQLPVILGELVANNNNQSNNEKLNEAMIALYHAARLEILCTMKRMTFKNDNDEYAYFWNQTSITTMQWLTPIILSLQEGITYQALYDAIYKYNPPGLSSEQQVAIGRMQGVMQQVVYSLQQQQQQQAIHKILSELIGILEQAQGMIPCDIDASLNVTLFNHQLNRLIYDISLINCREQIITNNDLTTIKSSFDTFIKASYQQIKDPPQASFLREILRWLSDNFKILFGKHIDSYGKIRLSEKGLIKHMQSKTKRAMKKHLSHAHRVFQPTKGKLSAYSGSSKKPKQ